MRPGESPQTERLTPPTELLPAGAVPPPPPHIPAGPNDLTLVGSAFAVSTSTPAPQRDRFPHLPGYAIQCELGRGGMGIVYRATQERLNRTVAVKMLLQHDVSDLSDVVRFRSEAEAVAAIPHPHVVKVYESDQNEGRPYFAMEYLSGGTLHAKLRGRAPFEADEAAGLVEKLARAVHAAHSIGIVHRDLKPGNVLFDEHGEPRVTDFGLAKRSSQELTKTQAVMGTPAYMPPEQAAGRAKYVGPPADIYALGVILYECLTGGTPFACEDSLALLNQVIADEPPSMRQKTPSVPRDLELICFKCLEKGPADRYQTAAELADDLRRYANREPVSVRPAGAVEKVVKWAKRRPTLATAYGLGVLAAALLLFGGGAAVLAVHAAWARDDANRHWRATEEARGKLEQQAGELEAARATADGHWKEAEKARDALQGKHEEVGTALAGEKKAKEALEKEHAALMAAREELERARYFANVSLAYKEARAGNFLRAADLLDDCPPARRGWEWWHAYRVAHVDVGTGVSPGQPMMDLAFSGNDIDLTTTHYGGIVTPFEFANGKGVQRRLGPVDSYLRVSADGKRAVAYRTWGKEHADGVSVWEVATGKQLAAFATPVSACLTCELSADGSRVLFQYSEQPARVFEVATRKELSKFPVPLAIFTRTGLSADGRVAAGVDQRTKEAVVWATDTGKEERRVTCEHGPVSLVGVSPDGKTVAVGSASGEVRFHPTGGEPVGVKRAHVGRVSAVAFSADGTWAATAGDDGQVRVWNPKTGEEVFRFHGHTRPVLALAFHPKGHRLASCDMAGGFRIWPLDETTPAMVKMGAGPRMKTAFSVNPPLTRLFAADDATDSGVEWRKQTNTEYPLRAPVGGRFTASALRPTGTEKVVGTAKGEVFLQANADKTPVPLDHFARGVKRLSYCDDGSRILGTDGVEFRVWESGSGKMLHAGTFADPADTAIGLSGDGKRLAVQFGQKAVTVVDVGVQKSYSVWFNESISMLAFTPDGQKFVVGTREWGLRVYPINPDDHERVLEKGEQQFVGHTSPVTSVGFSPDGKRVASGAADGSVRVWDTATGQEVIGLHTGTKEPITGVWFAAEGQLLAVQPEGGPPLAFDGSPRMLTLRPDKPEKVTPRK